MKTAFLIIYNKFFFLLYLAIVISSSQLLAQIDLQKQQEINITFKLMNQKREPLSFATITVTNSMDSSQIFKQLADSNGISVFRLIKGNPYTVNISSVNYKTVEKGIIISGNQTFLSFTAEPLAKTLRDVTVTSKRPLMRQEDDKTIVDPENLVASSSNGFEVIEKVPGIFMDQDGNIYLSSMTPAAVHINGREMKMSAADVASMLKSLPPNAILKIEILKTPSAKYEASGGGGIVNVILKKGVKIGMTGSITAGLQQGTYGNQFIGFNLNNNDGKKSSYMNFNYSKRNSYEKIITNRFFAADTILSQDAYTKYPGNGLYSNYGITWSIGKKWEIEYDGSINLNNFKNRSENESVIKKMSTDQVLVNNLNNVNNSGSSFTIGNGFESKYKIDSSGSEWENDIFTSYSVNKTKQGFTTTHYFPSIPVYGGDGKGNNHRYLLIAKSDLKLKLTDKLIIETGLRSSVHRSTNETDYFREQNSTRTKDFSRTNTFNYTENINAVYFQASKTFGKDVILKLGSRLENTNMKGNQIVPSDTAFNIHRTDLFPYIYLSKSIMKIAGYQLRAYLVHRRTIQRPVYDQLNPFARYVDQYLSEVGNPSLRPQFTKNYEFNVSYQETPVFAVGFNDTKDIFTNVIYQADSSVSQAYRTYDNLGKNKEWYFRGLGALPPGGKYFFVMGVQYNHNFYDGLYENKPLSYKRGTWMLFTYHTLKLGKRSQFSMNGFVRFKGLLQFNEVETFGALNTNINRRFIKDKLTVTLSANDIFFSNKYEFSIHQGSVNAYGLRKNDTRRFGINFRYNFGIRKKEESSMFNVESPE